jgi:hypothetical protein
VEDPRQEKISVDLFGVNGENEQKSVKNEQKMRKRKPN